MNPPDECYTFSTVHRRMMTTLVNIYLYGLLYNICSSVHLQTLLCWRTEGNVIRVGYSFTLRQTFGWKLFWKKITSMYVYASRSESFTCQFFLFFFKRRLTIAMFRSSLFWKHEKKEIYKLCIRRVTDKFILFYKNLLFF